MALGLIVLAAVAASAVSIRGMVNRLEAQTPADSEVTSWANSTETQVEKPQQEVPVLPSQSSYSFSGSSSESSSGKQQAASEPSATGAVAQSSTFILPVEGQVIAAFSSDELVYNETLADWRTHNGLDIAAPEGSVVSAAMPGTVTAVRQDDSWGTVVEVTGDDGRLLRYCGLTEQVSVTEGQMVQQSDPLGQLGTIQAETALEPHLHFEVEEDGTLIDPEELMR